LDRLTKAITSVEGVVAVILFGSRARGDYDEYSDYDVLVVFQDDEVMWRNRRKLYENVGKLGLFTQVLTRSIKELTEKTEPTFLQNVLQQGILLYLHYPFRAPALAQNLTPMAIVRYSLKNLTQERKMKIIYRLFGKKTKKYTSKGIVEKSGGIKLGDGCFMIPMENLKNVIEVLNQHNVQFKVLTTFTPG
jgi:predicted nucleotidyltransferase